MILRSFYRIIRIYLVDIRISSEFVFDFMKRPGKLLILLNIHVRQLNDAARTMPLMSVIKLK